MKSHGDTEVLAHLYLLDGFDFLDCLVDAEIETIATEASALECAVTSFFTALASWQASSTAIMQLVSSVNFNI